MSKRAIGIIRVSATRGREGESFHSPTTQLEAIERACQQNGWKLVEHHKEMDVSGTRPLAKRPGLKKAVEAIEAGRADLIVVAYFDRLMRSTEVKAEVVRRVEMAGGDVHAIDAGQITNGGATTKLTTTFLAAVAEYTADLTKEKVREAQVAAVALGIAPWPRVPLGYLRGADKRYVPDPKLAPVVHEAFQMRLQGQPVNAIRAMLAKHGVDYTYSGVYKLLAHRVYLGEVHFGELVNLAAHEPIIERTLFDRVQRVTTPRDHPQSPSDRLLARLGVLRCGTCDSRLVQNYVIRPSGRYVVYRCKAPDCPRKCSIAASLVESEVIGWVKAALAGLTGSASSASGAIEARSRLDRTQTAYAGAVAAFTGLDGPEVADRLRELREARDNAQAAYDDALAADETMRLVITAGDVFEHGSRDGQRELIKAVVGRVAVHPGRGVNRIDIEGR